MTENTYPKTMVICSTLNQMVNYIPINCFEPETIINLTIGKDKEKDERNKAWDENLKSQLKNNISFIDVPINIDNVLLDNLKDTIKEKIKDKEGESVLWNITGGQRYLTLAMYDIFKERGGEKEKQNGDYLCYLEGNTGEILVLKNNGGKIEKFLLI